MKRKYDGLNALGADWEDGEIKVAETRAGHVTHRSTDVLCCGLFLLGVIAFWFLFAFGVSHGHIDRLYRGYNFTGYMCGRDSEEQRPYVFFCKREGAIDVKHPICIEACPQDDSTSHNCYGKVSEVADEVVTETEVTSSRVTMTFAEYRDYPSKAIMETYCHPVDPELEAQVKTALGSRSYAGVHELIPSISEVWRCWPIFLVPLAIGTCLTVVYGILLVNDYGRCLLSCILCGHFVNAVILGVKMYHKSNFKCFLDKKSCWMGLLGWYEDWALIACILCAGFIIFVVCSRRFQDAFEAALGCMHAVMELQADKHGIFVGIPVSVSLVEVCHCFFLWYGLLCLMSTSHPQKLTLEEYAFLSESGATWFQKWYHGWLDDPMVWCYIGIWLWIRFTSFYLFIFATVHMTSIWYFTPWEFGHNNKKSLPFGTLSHALWVALRHHIGSIALAGFILPLVYPFRLMLKAAYRISGAYNSCTGRIIMQCCGCCLECYVSHLAAVDKTALIDISVRSTPFMESGQTAFHMLNTQNRVVRYLVGSSEIIVGLGATFAFTTAYIVVHILVYHVSPFNDPASSSYVDFPQFACLMSGLLGLVIVYSYLSMVDMVTDTLLYCRVSEEERIADGHLDKQRDYAPDSLVELIELFTHEHTEWKEQE